MPNRSPSLCVEPGCGEPTHKTRCPEHTRTRERETHDPKRQRVYHSRQWKTVRKRVLSRDVWCKTPGCTNLATDVDHVKALRDSDDPFDDANLQALCKRHHSQKTAAEVWGRKA